MKKMKIDKKIKAEIENVSEKMIREKSASEKIDKLKSDLAKAAVFENPYFIKHPERLKGKLDFVPSEAETKKIGGWKKVAERLSQGGLGIEQELDVLNGDFILGLKLGGGLCNPRRKSGNKRLRIKKHLARPLVEALEARGIYHKTGFYPTVHYIISPFLSHYPPETRNSASVIAGMLVSASWGERQGKKTIYVPSSRLVDKLAIDKWKIPHEYTYMGALVISPFFSALFSPYMPEAFWNITLLSQRATTPIHLCPELPLSMSSQVKKAHHMRSNMLPYMPSLAWARARGGSKFIEKIIDESERARWYRELSSGVWDVTRLWESSYEPELSAWDIVKKSQKKILTSLYQCDIKGA